MDVNILGHIFENSLNEIEELTAQILAEKQNKGHENKVHEINKGLQPLVNQKKQPLVNQRKKPHIQPVTISKRKKDGVFYTPKYITKYIVENTVGKLCEEKRNKLALDENEYLKSRKGRTKKKLQELDKKLNDYRNWLLSLTICDPACGSGAFLNQALDFLIREHKMRHCFNLKL